MTLNKWLNAFCGVLNKLVALSLIFNCKSWFTSHMGGPWVYLGSLLSMNL